jgi:nicotinamide-nucleotide adenylyltransferase
MARMVKRGIYVGRFQPFHLGHLHAISDILEEVEEIIIAIGSAQYSHNITNPFTAGERLIMIRKALEEAEIAESRFWIAPVPDVHLHMMWVSSVVGYTPKFNVVYSNEPLTSRLFLEAGYNVKAIRLFERELYSSTLIRERMLKSQKWEELVPKSVATFIKEIDGVNRIQDLMKSDKI